MAFAVGLRRSYRMCSIGISVLCGGLLLSGCIGNSVYDQLNTMTPVGDPFSMALFKDYAYLARSFGTQSAPQGQAFDAAGSISLTEAGNTISGVANQYAEKALAAGRGDEVLPEIAPEEDADAENVRFELLRDLNDARDKAPDEAARAQVDYDCWIINRRVPELASAARTCRRSVTESLARLERENNPSSSPPAESPAPASAASNPTPPPSPVPAPSPPPAPAQTAQPADFAVYFDFRSARLADTQLTAVAQAIAAARAGRQSHINVVGHTDTAEDSQRLSLRRAEAVKDALVELGARVEAISVSGTGQKDLAVQTDSGVKEAKNRRVVITLVP